jgi:excisionase family DNA binding protein
MKEVINDVEYLSVSTIAKELDCSKRTVQHYIATGKIEAFKIFGRLVVDRAYFAEWKKRNAEKKKVG